MWRAAKLLLLSCALLWSGVPGAAAHDFWIEPGAFRPEAGDWVYLRLRIGQNYVGNSQPYIPEFFTDYRVVRPDDKSVAIDAYTGDDPAGRFEAAEPGVYVVGYRSKRDVVQLEPERFHQYLKEEGLEFIIQRRIQAGTADEPSRETYSRCAKSLVFAGPTRAAAAAKGYDRTLGYTLELIPERNPYALRPGDALPVRLVYEGAPLPGALVIAFTKERPEARVQARTDAAGRVQLTLPHAGSWLVKAVHMVDAPPDTDARLESFWASLTFALPKP